MRSTEKAFLSAHGSFAAAIDSAGSGLIWDARTGKPLAMLADAESIVWPEDESRIAVYRRDGSVWILNADGTVRSTLPVFPGIQEPEGKLYWSPDGGYLAHSVRGVLHVWAIE
jgi:hypothetical protein